MPRKGEIKDRTGERFVNNQGCSFFIVEYNHSKDLWVQFEDKHGAKVHVEYNQCTRGSVKNPYHPTVWNVGYIGRTTDGVTPTTAGENYKKYRLWYEMLRRCYSKEYHEKYPTYKNCSLCERWHSFANFLEDLPLIEGYELWVNNNDFRAIHLDKDIKGGDRKIYSLETCMFVDQAENVREMSSRCDTQKRHRIKVVATNINNGEKLVFDSILKASKTLGVHVGSVSNCLSGKSKTAGGYTWENVGDKCA